MAQSSVDCCNSALQKLGAASIMNLGDNSREARQCTIAYDSSRRAELRKHSWNFSIKRAVLSPDVAAPGFGFTRQFTLPSDCLRILPPSNTTLDWVVEGRKILTNDGDVLNLRYVADITDVTQWDPVFYEMVATRMAGLMCEAITNSTSKKALLQQDYKEARAEARKNNAFEKLPADSADGSWLVARA